MWGQVLRGAVRQGEYAGRIGGEEFAVLLPDADGEQGAALAGRILERVRTVAAGAGSAEPAPVTVSVGVAAGAAAASTLDDLLQRADTALYHAKREGRDRMAVWQGAED